MPALYLLHKIYSHKETVCLKCVLGWFEGKCEEVEEGRPKKASFSHILQIQRLKN